ncbi:MAG TPA: hypothetical protein VGM93_12480, partial [Acidimicrobiales bacterium]
ASVIKHQVETLRRLKYRPTGGFAVYSLADSDPRVSWSVLDHERVPKAGYAALQAACRPVIVVAERLPAEATVGQPLELDVHVVSDRRAALPDAVVTARLAWDGGQQDWRFGGTIPADSCVRVGAVSITVPDAPGIWRLELALSGPDEHVTNTYDGHITRSPAAG